MSTSTFLSVISPVFNESETIYELVNRVSHLTSKFERFELILINDGSTDDSKQLLDEICRLHPWVRVIHFSRNFGHQIAVMAGLRNSRGDVVAIIDGDLQDPPELISEMIDRLNQGYDIVYGERVSRSGESVIKLITAHMFYKFLNKISDIYIPPNVGDFRVVSRRAAKTVAEIEEPYPFIRGLFAYTGYPSVAFKYCREKRFAGKTKYPMKQMFRLAGHALYSFSEAPIRLAFRTSLIFSMISLIGLVVTIVNLTISGSTPGWLSLISSVCFFGSVNVFFLALLLKYAELTLRSVRRRPLYIAD